MLDRNTVRELTKENNKIREEKQILLHILEKRDQDRELLNDR